MTTNDAISSFIRSGFFSQEHGHHTLDKCDDSCAADTHFVVVQAKPSALSIQCKTCQFPMQWDARILRYICDTCGNEYIAHGHM